MMKKQSRKTHPKASIQIFLQSNFSIHATIKSAAFRLPRCNHSAFTGRMPPLPRPALCLLIGAIAALTSLAQDHLEPSQPPKPAAIMAGVSESSVDLDKGRRLFETHCAICHGPRGEGGKGPTLAQPSLPRASDEESLIRIISQGIPNTEMPQARMQRADILLIAKFVKSLGAQPREPVPGDPQRGLQVYATKGACAQCHIIRGEGGVFGPDLSDVGRRRSPAYLRRALVDPNADVPQSYSAWRSDVGLPENFLYVRLVTRGGQELAGVRVNEDTFSIQIREATGAVHSFLKSDLAELHKDFGKSPMPTYATALTTNELDDLVAFLTSLRVEK
jgi:cytochrome c oxidase cbb3-type subunit 3